MKRVGILSINLQVYTVNYGSTLQSYALWRKLTDLGYDAEIVDYSADVRAWMNPKRPFLVNKKIYRGDRLRFLLNWRGGVRKWKEMQDFLRNEARVSPVQFSSHAFDTDRYDLYVVGSDTVWDIRQLHGFEPAFFGTFPCMRKVVAYAPSFGQAVYSDEEARTFRKHLERFSAVSIREPVNMDAFGDRRDDIPVVLDPTMLHDAAHYAKLAIQPRIKGKYVLLYAVYQTHGTITQAVDDYAVRHGCSVVEISFYRNHAHPRFWNAVGRVLYALRFVRRTDVRRKDNRVKLPHRMMYGAGTREFLGLVQNAEMVVTNSFHGSVFAILFGKKFFNFTRQRGSEKIRQICSILGIEGRTLAYGEPIRDDPIDYENAVFPRLEKLRAESAAFLESAARNALGE